MDKKMNNKGVIITIDAMLAYATAFTFAGVIIVLLNAPNESESMETLQLHYWAEDIAEIVSQNSHNWNSSDGYIEPEMFSCTTHSPILSKLTSEIKDLADRNDIWIMVTGLKDYSYGAITITGGSADTSNIAVANRMLLDDDGHICIMTVKVGR